METYFCCISAQRKHASNLLVVLQKKKKTMEPQFQIHNEIMILLCIKFQTHNEIIILIYFGK